MNSMCVYATEHRTSLEVQHPGVETLEGLGLLDPAQGKVEGIYTLAAGANNEDHEAGAVAADVLEHAQCI